MHKRIVDARVINIDWGWGVKVKGVGVTLKSKKGGGRSGRCGLLRG